MKLIVAYLQSSRLSEVIEALEATGVVGISVGRVRGFGRRRVASGLGEEHATGALHELPRERLEVAVADGLVEPVLRAIEGSAHTGLSGDGKVFVLTVLDALHIRTGARGEDALP